jgi:hypothetical protein
MIAAIIRRLGAGEVDCLLFGGWAEEAIGLAPPSPHSDLDLLLPSQSFEALDDLLSAAPGEIEEVRLKRFAHKRAFLTEGTLVEVTLVQELGEAIVTWFWGDVHFEWQHPLAAYCELGGHHLAAASRENLRRYRACHRSLEPWRWQDPASLIPGKHPREHPEHREGAMR